MSVVIQSNGKQFTLIYNTVIMMLSGYLFWTNSKNTLHNLRTSLEMGGWRSEADWQNLVFKQWSCIRHN